MRKARAAGRCFHACSCSFRAAEQTFRASVGLGKAKVMESVRLALSLLENIAATGPIGVSALARKLGEPKTTVHRSLQTLHAAGWIRSLAQSAEHGRQRLWTLSPKLLSLAQSAGHPRLRDTA